MFNAGRVTGAAASLAVGLNTPANFARNLSLAQKAAAKGINEAIEQGSKQFSQEAGGIKFRVYLDRNNPTIIKNFHPEF